MASQMPSLSVSWRVPAQTQLAIAVMQALTPVLGTIVPPEGVRDFESSVANLQLAYANAAAQPPSTAEEKAAEPEESPEKAEKPEEPEEPEGESEG